jgi:site-specific DNA recombinase
MASGVRAILKNSIYVGRIEWNTTTWQKHPDTKRRLQRRRPESEWVVRTGESIRIISDELFARAQRRARGLKDSDPRLKSGGRPRYLLSGLLRCESCGSNFILANANSYACSSFINGRACDNGTLVRRDELEDTIVRPLHDGLLAPRRVERMAKELEAEFAAYTKAGETVPQELVDLDARIVRLKARLNAGDPDMTADEIQAGIDRAEAKRRELKAPPAAQAKVLAMLPAAAAAYREQIKAGLDGDPIEALKARVVLRDLVGIVRMIRDEHGLWAQWRLNPAALLKGQLVAGRDSEL